MEHLQRRNKVYPPSPASHQELPAILPYQNLKKISGRYFQPPTAFTNHFTSSNSLWYRSKQLIKDAILDNDFLKNLDSCQIREIVDSMYPRGYQKGTYVIREGDNGAHLFVSAEGEYEVIKDGNVLGRMGTGKAFGELAILYNCTRTASIRG